MHEIKSMHTSYERTAGMTNASVSGPVCGGEVSGPEGEIRSPGYPHGYASWRQCKWIIIAPVGKRIKLEFLDFDMPNRGPGRRSFCRDNVQVMSRNCCELNFEIYWTCV